MRKYKDEDERKIRTTRHVQEWMRSRLLGNAQYDLLTADLKVGLRRTNLFLRLILFGFGLLIIAASVLLVGMALRISGEAAIGLLSLLAAAGCFFLGEFLIHAYQLYRFGIEEAAVAAGAILAAIAAAALTSSLQGGRSGELPFLVGLVVGSIGAFAVYARFGYVYAAIASMLCMSMAPFQTGLSEVMQRLVSASLLASVFLAIRSIRRKSVEEFPADDYGRIQALAWAGVYAVLNLQLGRLFSQRQFTAPVFPPFFYWFTYAAIWIVPAVGLYLALRDRDRPFIDISLVLALATLISNKPYLSLPRQTWDPVIFGALLITTAVILRRWLSSGERNGFTAERLLSSDKRRLAMAGIASAAFRGIPDVPAGSSSTDTLQSGGGRSGGAGASGSF